MQEFRVCQKIRICQQIRLFTYFLLFQKGGRGGRGVGILVTMKSKTTFVMRQGQKRRTDFESAQNNIFHLDLSVVLNRPLVFLFRRAYRFRSVSMSKYE